MMMRQPVQVWDMIQALLGYLPPARPKQVLARDSEVARYIVQINWCHGIVGASRRPTSQRSFEQWVGAIRRGSYTRKQAKQGPYRYRDG